MRKTTLLILSVLACIHSVAAKKVSVGTGSGSLSYPNAQTTLGLSPGDTIAIKPGTYSGLSIGNLRGTPQAKVVITNGGGLVEFANFCSGCSASLTDAVNVIFTGSGAPGIAQGFSFHDLPYRALQLGGEMDSTTISDCRFANVVDNVIRINPSSVPYDGMPGTLTSGMKFLRNSFENCGNAVDWGNYAGTTDQLGVGRDIEIAYNTVDSCQGGEAFRLNKVYRANVHHNTITNMGLALTTSHPGIVMLRGDGDIHHNYFHNVWGVCARGFGAGLDGIGEIRVHDNLFLGSRKYSAVEAQTFSTDVSSDTTVTPHVGICNYRVFNNTMGNQSARDFTAAMVDVYTLMGAKCEIRNNLGFNIAKDKAYSPTSNYVYNLENPNPPDTSNNLYRPNFSELGLADSLDCKLLPGSIAIDKGVTSSFVVDDYAGVPRPQGSAPDIGAREFISTARVNTSQSHFADAGIRIASGSDGRRIQVSAPYRIDGVSIRSLDGHSLTSRPGNGTGALEIDVGRLPQALYLVTIHSAGRVATRLLPQAGATGF